MIRNAKAKGTYQEHRSMKLLESAGYAVTRSAASLGAWDIVGISSTDFVLVQVKSGRWPSPAEMQTLQNFPVPNNCKKLVHRWNSHARAPEVKEL